MDSDIIFCILEHLAFLDIIRCTSVNKQFNHVSNNELLWKKMSEEDYLNKIDDDYEKSYRSHYRLYKFFERCGEHATNGGQKLNLSWKNLKSIPSEICLLTNLRELYLHVNRLKVLPVELSRLTNLTQLDLDSNNLEFIPVEFNSLTKLETLYVDRTQFRLVPSHLLHLIDEK
jgi:Leucine-rich repeat (LRR) protein